MRVLVTGGAGFMGSPVAEALLARGHRVTVPDNLSEGFLDSAISSSAYARIGGPVRYRQVRPSRAWRRVCRSPGARIAVWARQHGARRPDRS